MVVFAWFSSSLRPVHFLQDAINFPDLIHAAKTEPHNEIPQAATAHDTFWDFISLTPEAMHMVMRVMSDRPIPRSYALMDGFGVRSCSGTARPPSSARASPRHCPSN